MIIQMIPEVKGVSIGLQENIQDACHFQRVAVSKLSQFFASLVFYDWRFDTGDLKSLVIQNHPDFHKHILNI